MKGQISVLGEKGDVKVEWDSDNPREVDFAKKIFKENLNKNFMAFRSKKSGGKGDQIREFDPYAEKIIFVPPMAGG